MTYKKVRLIEKAPLPLSDKISLLLVYAQQKPAALINVMGVNYGGLEGEQYFHLVRRIEGSLRQLKMPYTAGSTELFQRIIPSKRYPDGSYTNLTPIYAGQTKEIADRLEEAVKRWDEYEIGLLLGYPETAVQAYLGLRLRFTGNHDDGTVLRNYFTGFIFSQEYFNEEFQSTSVRWHDTVKKLSPKLYNEAEKQLHGTVARKSKK